MALKVAQRTLQKMLAFHLRFACNSSAFCLQFICVLLAIHPRFACNSSAKACNFSYRLYLLGTKNAAVKNCCAILVIPLRFERRTHALEGRCSIQLSYGTSLKNWVQRYAFSFYLPNIRCNFYIFFPLMLILKGKWPSKLPPSHP